MADYRIGQVDYLIFLIVKKYNAFGSEDQESAEMQIEIYPKFQTLSGKLQALIARTIENEKS